MASPIEEIAISQNRTIKISGPVNSGKTQALIMRCKTLLEAGVAPEQILVVCASSYTAGAFKRRLSHTVGEDIAHKIQQMHIETALSAISNTLNKPEIQALTGRSGRLFSKFEYNFILEDMKTLGQPRRDLRNMLNYFYRNWAQLSPDEEWYFGDAIPVCEKLQGMCAALGGISEFEAPYICAKFLKSNEGEEFRGAFEYVICDDFQNLSHAQQIAICLHAHTQLIVAGDAAQWSKISSDYPFVEGFSKFEQVRRNVEVFNLCNTYGNSNIQKVADSLNMESYEEDDISYSEAKTPVQRIKWTTPKDEIVGMTKSIRKEFNDNAEELERNWCVLVPNKRFARMYDSALRARGFKTSLAGMGTNLGGDPRDSKTCAAALAYVKLNLIARPTDGVAWRAWCGFDDALCNSQSFEGLYAYANEHNKPILECLKEISENINAGGEEPFPRAKKLAQRYVQGCEIIEKNEKRRGFALLSAVDAQDLQEYEFLNDILLGKETVQELFAIVEQNLFAPILSENPHVLNIMSYEHMAGLSFENAIAVALVDGYMPRRNAFEVVSTDEDRAAFMESERRSMYCALGKIQDNLYLSYFTKCDLELAERTKMQVSRIRSEDGARIALSRPSCFFTDMEAACPSTLSGQAFLSERGLN
jgi:hypothetical protein